MIKLWDTITTKKGDKYSVRIIFDESGKLSLESSCVCPYGSFHRWSRENKVNKWQCRHIVKSYAKMTKQTYENARKTLIKQGLMDENHIKRI